MRVIVTGSTGFVGKHLTDTLTRRGHEVIAPSRPENMEPELVVKAYSPDAVIHLAAQSNIKRSWDEPVETVEVNTLGSLRWLAAISSRAKNAKLLSIGSGEEYGLTGRSGKPLVETDPCSPQNPYAVSKYAAGQLLLQLAGKHGLSAVHLRAFNHFGPGQREGFVFSDFASQIARIERGWIEPVLRVGDLTALRDFTDVRDMVQAYVRFLENDVESGVYNLCSGIPRSIRHVLDALLKHVRVPIDVITDPDRLRPSDMPIFIASAAKAAEATGWFPLRNFEESAQETLDWWRNAIASESADRPKRSR